MASRSSGLTLFLLRLMLTAEDELNALSKATCDSVIGQSLLDELKETLADGDLLRLRKLHTRSGSERLRALVLPLGVKFDPVVLPWYAIPSDSRRSKLLDVIQSSPFCFKTRDEAHEVLDRLENILTVLTSTPSKTGWTYACVILGIFARRLSDIENFKEQGLPLWTGSPRDASEIREAIWILTSIDQDGSNHRAFAEMQGHWSINRRRRIWTRIFDLSDERIDFSTMRPLGYAWRLTTGSGESNKQYEILERIVIRDLVSQMNSKAIIN
jgi:hypothetical protein